MRSYLGVADIAKLLNKERSTIVRWIQAGKFGKVRKVGNEYRVPYDDFQRWWDENMRGGSPSERRR